MLPGVSVQDINKRIDERGFFAEIVRNDWKDLLRDDKIAQANLSLSHPGMIRAWHRHKRGQVDYLIVARHQDIGCKSVAHALFCKPFVRREGSRRGATGLE